MSENEKKEVEQKFHYALGAVPSPVDLRDYTIAAAAVGKEFPEEFSLTPPPVKNQTSTGSCVANSLSAAFEYFNTKQNNDDTKMSIVYIYGNRRGSTWKGVGMIPRDALKNALSYGNCYYDDFPGNPEVPEAIDVFEKNADALKPKAYPHRMSAFYRLNNENEIKDALMKWGPVPFVVLWYKDMKYSNGVLNSAQRDSKTCDGSHCMFIYGWNKEGWLIQNSWGILWGNKGRAILPFDFPLTEAWGIADNIVEGELEKPFNSKFGTIIAAILNAIIRLFKK